ncbi:hypothetical protein, partial [Escherichia coli]|uniref:hypothetical protein n=1 Tax=Escherichia coli TaxID=562 RepID=UPI0032DBA4AB
MELIKDYDLEIQYHEGKANKVADALSRKTNHTLWILPQQLCKEFQGLNLEVKLSDQEEREGRLYYMTATPTLFEEIKRAQEEDSWMGNIKEKMVDGKHGPFELHPDGSVRFQGRWVIPRGCKKIMEQIMKEGHYT